MNKRYYWLFPVFLAALCNITALRNQFVWDDTTIIADVVPQLNTIGDAFFKRGIFQASTSYYRPLVNVNYMIARALGGASPFWYHALVWFYHIAATALLFFFTRSLLRRSSFSDKAALLAASLFAIHPAHSEVVAWMSGCNDALLALFSIATLLSALLYFERPRFFTLVLFAASFAGALFSKEPAIALMPLVLLLPFFNPSKRNPNKNGMATIIACMAIVFVIYLRCRFSYLEGSGVLSLAVPPWKALIDTILSFAFYIQAFFAPLNISFYIAEIKSSPFLFILFAAFIAAGVTCARLERKRTDKILTFCIAFFILTIAPAMTVAFSKYSETPLAIRYLYLPSAGLCILIAYLFFESENLFTGTKLRAYQISKGSVALVVMILLIVINFKYIAVWHDTVTFWEDAIIKTPKEGLPHHELGHAYQKLGRLLDAKQQYELALASNYDNEGLAYSSNNLGAIYLSLGDRQKAMELFKQASGFDPSYYNPHFNTGYLLFEDAVAAKSEEERGPLLTQAIRELETAVQLYAYGAKEFFILGEAYKLKGDEINARSAYESAVRVGGNSNWGALAKEKLGQK